MKYFGIILLLLSTIWVKGQEVYSNYIINPFDYWSFGTAIVEYNDTVYIHGNGGQTVDFRNIYVARLNSYGLIDIDRKIQRHQTIFNPSRCKLIKKSDGLYSAGIKETISGVNGYIYKLDNNLNILDSVVLQYNGYRVITYTFIETLDNCFALSGYLSTSQLENKGIVLFKLDSNLNIMWTKVYKPSITNRSRYLYNTPDNGFLICGMKSNNVIFSEDPLVIKTDSNGIEEWSWDNGNSLYDDGAAVAAATSDGGYIISFAHAVYQSTQYPPLPSQKKIRLVKLNGNGVEEWTKDYGMTNIHNRINTILPLSDNNFVVNCATSSANCEMAVLLKTSSSVSIR